MRFIDQGVSPPGTLRLILGRGRGGEFGGQPIEQLRMRRAHAVVAEIAGGADDAAAEMMLPDAVDHDAGGHRIVLRRDPVGEHRAPAGRFVPGLGAGIDGSGRLKTDGKPGSTLSPGRGDCRD